jgi:hypothetical protein
MKPLASEPNSISAKTCGKRRKRPDRAWTKPNKKPHSASPLEAGIPGSDLARVMAAWPGLPDHIRATILTLIQICR